ncbi:unnamed protein product, partial [Musa textilis]
CFDALAVPSCPQATQMVKRTICFSSITGVWLKAVIRSSNLNEKDGRRNLFSCAESCSAMTDDNLS